MLPLLFFSHLVIPGDNLNLPALSVKRSLVGQVGRCHFADLFNSSITRPRRASRCVIIVSIQPSSHAYQ